jgi:hypothetical protein
MDGLSCRCLQLQRKCGRYVEVNDFLMYVVVYILFALPCQVESFKAETAVDLESFTI